MLESRLAMTLGIGQSNPELGEMDAARRIADRVLAVHDAATGGHQIHLPGANDLFYAQAVAMQNFALHHPAKGLQPDVRVPVADGRTLAVVVLHGTVEINGVELAREGQLVVLARDGADVQIEANDVATLLLLSGEPLDEPIAAYGPFVMNSDDEIRQAITDFRSGDFGRIAPSPA